MPSTFSRRIRFAGVFASLLVLLALGAFAWVWQSLQKSLPPLDGVLTVDGLGAPTKLERDAAGVVTIRAATHLDAIRALGFAHGQDRFFQMDLLRRSSAGELSALVGAPALPLDRRAVIHRFRRIAEERFAAAPPDLRTQLETYAEGVNAGLASPAAKPWEYLALRTTPEPWRPADTLLVSFAMALTLQDPANRYEWDLTILRDELGPRAVDFFAPLIGPADSALDGTTAPLGEAPTARAINLRARTDLISSADPIDQDLPAVGSNGFGVPGARTAHRAALLAGDPHLDLNLPNTWYRAALTWTDDAGQPFRVEGLTLPGVPTVLIGSNGHLAWTFTNSYTDTSDLVEIDLNPTAPELIYMKGSELMDFEKHTDIITVKGGDPVTVESTWTIWGPLVYQSRNGRPYAQKWTLADPAATDLSLLRLATTTDFDAAVTLVQTAGISPQNILLASADGRLTWTVAGRLPQRFGFDGRLPTKWTYGDRGWDGFLPPDQVPRHDAAPDGFLWSANQRLLGGEPLTRLGDGGYESPARASRIAERLAALPAGSSVQPADLLGVQLDTHATWLEPWRDLLLATIDALPADRRTTYQAFRDAIAESHLNADVDARGYRLLRTWVRTVARRTLDPIFARCRAIDPAWTWGRFNIMPALYSLHHDGGRLHLLAAEYADWSSLRLAAIDTVMNDLDVGHATWGERNRARISHPFSSLLPGGLGSWLSMPPDPLPGDHDVPRVQSPGFGASARLVVSPGHEDEGILHVPGGQSGHPFSPFFQAGHRDWVEGNASPFQPGPTEHTLELTPP